MSMGYCSLYTLVCRTTTQNPQHPNSPFIQYSIIFYPIHTSSMRSIPFHSIPFYRKLAHQHISTFYSHSHNQTQVTPFIHTFNIQKKLIDNLYYIP